jgi:hypothetical protein
MAKKIVPPAAVSKAFEGITWAASRPAVLPHLVEALDCHWGVLVRFHGTEAELIAAGVASPEMFEGIGKSGQKTRLTGSGDHDQYTVKKRRAGWDLEIRTSRDDLCAPTDEYPRPNAWWRKHGGEAQAATAAILARLRATRRVAHG